MKQADFDGPEPGMRTGRIEALSDGVFAIAMTLLVLDLALPGAGETVGLREFLGGQVDRFFNYALSFLLLAVFWVRHHQQFHFIKRTDAGHLWINIFFLMFVALLPFSTSLLGDYPDEALAEAFFGGNILMLGLLLTLSWAYATRRYRLVDRGLDPRHIALPRERGMLTIIVAASAIAVAFVNPDISSYLYLLILVLQIALARRHRRPRGKPDSDSGAIDVPRSGAS